MSMRHTQKPSQVGVGCLRAQLRSSAAVVPLAVVACLAIVVGGCREHIRLDDATAIHLNDPVKRHPIHYAGRGEALLIEMAGKGEGLSRNQRADLTRFLQDYKAESVGNLTVAAPGSVRGHLAVSRSVRDVIDEVHEAGIPERYVDVIRSDTAYTDEFGPAIAVSYDRQVAVAPQCGHWPDDVDDIRERLPQQNFGCSTQRNLALTVANARDLQGPQAETPRSSERRAAKWSEYIKGSSGGDDGGSMVSPMQNDPQKPPGAGN
ncbi:MAG: CpaD family pilus assembly lipoprotein [Pseudomonadota bacterium]